MSSHHFVKEGQEPALFIVDTLAFRCVESLLEWVPLIIVADRALEQVLPWRIKIDVVLQQEYALEAVEDLIKDQGPVQILPCGKDDVVKRGLQFLIHNSHDAVNLVSRSREEIFREAEKSAHKLQVGIYNELEKWSLISTGKFEKWMPRESRLLIRSDSLVQTEGVVQKGAYWETSGAGIVTVRSESAFWIGEQH